MASVDVGAVAPNFRELQSQVDAMPESLSPRVVAMLLLAERIRAAGGGVPVRVTSWRRSGIGNALAGGSPTSQHLTAEAQDYVPIGVPIREWFDRVVASLPRSTFGQLIFERNHVHASLPGRKVGEVLDETSEGVFVPIILGDPADDSREGGLRVEFLAVILLFLFTLFVVGGGRG